MAIEDRHTEDADRPGVRLPRPQTLRDPEFEPPSPQSRPREPARLLKRSDVYTRPVVDGRQVRENVWTRLRAWLQMLVTSSGEKEEAELERRLRAQQRGVTRSNTLAVVSPKGGVGKTTCTFLVGNLLSSHLNLRAIAVDGNPDFGTLGLLVPDALRSVKTLADMINDLDHIHSASELRPYVSPLPTGLHVMAAPESPDAMKQITPEGYGRLTAFLANFYDVVLLDLGTGLTDPLAEFALARADQSVVVTTPEWATSNVVLGALRHLAGDQETSRLTVVLNQAPVKETGERQVIEAGFRKQKIKQRITIPYDEQLRTMLDSGTYTLEQLLRPIRLPIKQLGLAVAGQLV